MAVRLKLNIMVVVMVVVAYIAFLLFQYVGDPVVFLLGQNASPQQIRDLRSALGLDRFFGDLPVRQKPA